MRLQAVASIAMLLGAGAALAQDVTDDWEVIRQPEQKTVMAFVPMDSGLTIGFRCVDGVYGAVIAGLPAVSRNDRTRVLKIAHGDEEPHDTVWNVTTDATVAVADYPAPFARGLRDGGPISIVIPDGAGPGRNLRHNLVLPASTAAIDETLTACSRPVTDPRDALLPQIEEGGLPHGLTWARQPRPTYPRTNYSEGSAVLSCLLRPDGGLEQCVVESEFPVDGGFGRSALRATEDARLNSPEETQGQYAPRMVAFRNIYRMR